VPFAVRSSAADEDGADASFAGQHLTLLNIATVDDVPGALREIWWSANSDSAITYRKRVGLFTRPSVGVVIQSLLDPDAAGVMFTRNPVTGAEERIIEATWGLGEAVVQGLVIPDSFQLDRDGKVLMAAPGRKQIAIRKLPDGGTVEEEVAAERVEQLCLSEDHLRQLGELATKAEAIYGEGRDIEWAVVGGTLYLLQCRAVTAGATSDGHSKTAPPAPAPVEKVEKVPFFAGLDRHEVEEIAALFKERRFAAGETVVLEGAAGAAFFLIDSGEATVSVHGVDCGTLSEGDHFGEIALIDEGPRAATVTATTDLVCHGLTFWEFQPLVERNGVIGWKLLQSMAKMLRDAEEEREQPA
jgi:pyruvate,water dikinase